MRDQTIAGAVRLISREYNLSPTRNAATADKGVERAASIVAKALSDLGVKMKESTINAIWTRMSDPKCVRPFLARVRTIEKGLGCE
jgi:hypothetical protein